MIVVDQADPNARDRPGLTPTELAAKGGHEDTAAAIAKALKNSPTDRQGE